MSSSRRDCCPDYNLEAFDHRAYVEGCLAGRPGVLQDDGQDGVLVVVVRHTAERSGRGFADAREKQTTDLLPAR